MKKAVIGLLTVVCVLCYVLTACKGNGEPVPTMKAVTDEGIKELPMVTVLVDMSQSNLTPNAVSDLLNTTPGYGSEFMIITETIPDIWTGEQQRDTALTRVRTEILAGGGPDILLCENPIMENGNRGSAVFQFPRQAMDSHVLLPLEGYIEESERMDWDKLAPRIMEAGKNSEGQQILPLTYGFHIMTFNKDKFTLETELPMTFDEMLESPDRMVQYTSSCRWMRSIFGQIEDYEHDEMLIPEEEIVKRIEEMQGLSREDFSEFYVEDPLHDRGTVGNYSIGGYSPMSCGGGIDYWLVPSYNTEGGITATIGAFAAINRNTKQPENSFRVVETIFTAQGQNSDMLKQLNGQPVHMDIPCAGWSSSEWNESQYAALMEQINAVVFRTPVEHEFESLMDDINADSGKGLDEIVHEHYVKMQMMLAES